MGLHGWVVYNGHLPGEKFLTLAEWFKKAAEDQGLTATIFKNNELLSFLHTKTSDLLKTKEDRTPDFVIFTDKDIYLAKQLEQLNIPVFNSADAIAISDDKIASYQVLAQHDLPIPETIIAPKIFPVKTELDPNYIDAVIEKLGLPMVMKEAFGSFGEQVYLVHSRVEMIKKIKELHDRPFVFQEFIETSFGKDLRLHVVGDHVAASMYRETTDDFRATAGGIREGYNPTPYEAELAIKASKAIGTDFAGVDLLYGPNDTRIVCEVNSNAHIGKLYNCTKINVADHIVSYIIHTLKKQP